MRPNRLAVAVTAAVVSVVVAGCSAKTSGRPEAHPTGRAVAVPAAASPEDLAKLRSLGYVSDGAGPSSGDASARGAALAASWSARKLIRTGSVEIDVDDVPAATARVRAACAPLGAFVAGSDATLMASGRRHARLTVQVPSERFDALLHDAGTLGTVRTEHAETADVSKTYADLETRLGVKRQAEARLRNLLEHRTGDLSDVLAVERELDRVVTEIEGMEGERRYYDQQVAMSTLTIELSERETTVWPYVAAGFAAGFVVLVTGLAWLVRRLLRGGSPPAPAPRSRP